MNQREEVVWTENLSDPRLSQRGQVLEASQAWIGSALRVPDPRCDTAARRESKSNALVITGAAIWLGGKP
ncbi:MAG: hypothetical protein HYV16_04570 [Gammaproteobacteria bacterium]|nr:hypothetical protein [Gammaproteobacteria bacterium]